MSVSEHFDVAVLGGTLSATIVSSLLAERRYRGVLIDQGELSRSSSSGLSDLVLADNASAVMQFVHSELRLNDRLARQTKPLDTFLQVVFPDERIDVRGSREHLIQEFGRGFGQKMSSELKICLGQLDALEQRSSELLGEIGVLPCHGFLAKRVAAATARRYKDFQMSIDSEVLSADLSVELKAFLLGLLPFITFLDAREIGEIRLLHMVRPVLRLLRGATHFEEGRGLRHVFEQHTRRGGFRVYEDAVDKVQLKEKRHILSLTESRRQISCDYVIDASSDLSGIGALPSKQLRSLAKTLQDARQKGALHAFAFEVDEKVVPPGMSNNVLLLNGRQELRDLSQTAPEDRPILLLRRTSGQNSSPPTKSKVETSTKRVRLIALHPLSSAESHVTNEIDNVIRARIRRLIPFLDLGKPRGETVFAAGNKRVPTALLSHPLYDACGDKTWGVSGVSNVTSVKNVLIAGPAVLPGLGLEGEYLSSLQVCDELDRRARGTKWPKTMSKRIGMKTFQ
jgi:hypothetical protein